MKPPAPRRTRSDPPTAHDDYREVAGRFRQELAEHYRDPRAARRAFDVELGRYGAAHVVHVLAETPERYGKLRITARRERIAATVPWAERYADWHRTSTRAARYAAAELLEAAALPGWTQDARAAVHAAIHDRKMLPEKARYAAAGKVTYESGLAELYADPTAAGRAIETYSHRHGADAAQVAIEKSPDRFGTLRLDASQGWLSRQWNGPHTSVARWRAMSLTYEFRAAQAERPQPDGYSRAWDAETQAQRFAEALDAKLARLPHQDSRVYAREALQVIDRAARASGTSGDRIMRQVRPMLPDQAIGFAIKALNDIVRGQERERRTHDRRRGYGIDL